MLSSHLPQLRDVLAAHRDNTKRQHESRPTAVDTTKDLSAPGGEVPRAEECDRSGHLQIVPYCGERLR